MKPLVLWIILAVSALAARAESNPGDAAAREVQQAVTREVTPQFAAAAKAVALQEPIDFEALDTAVRHFLAEWPDTDIGWQLLPTYLRFARVAQPERTEREWLETFLDSPNRSVRAFAKNRLSLAAMKTEPLELRFTALDGRKVDMAALRGKVVLIDFWASWCKPCIAELPNVKRVYAGFHAQGFEIIGVSLDNAKDRQKFVDLVAREGVTWPQRFDGQGWEDSLSRRFTITSIPATFLFDQTGCLVASDLRGSELETAVKNLLDR